MLRHCDGPLKLPEQLLDQINQLIQGSTFTLIISEGKLEKLESQYVSNCIFQLFWYHTISSYMQEGLALQCFACTQSSYDQPAVVRVDQPKAPFLELLTTVRLTAPWNLRLKETNTWNCVCTAYALCLDMLRSSVVQPWSKKMRRRKSAATSGRVEHLQASRGSQIALVLGVFGSTVE